MLQCFKSHNSTGGRVGGVAGRRAAPDDDADVVARAHAQRGPHRPHRHGRGPRRGRRTSAGTRFNSRQTSCASLLKRNFFAFHYIFNQVYITVDTIPRHSLISGPFTLLHLFSFAGEVAIITHL